MGTDKITTAMGTPNIALIKYWGKRDNTGLNTPNNSSIGLTMDENLSTKTSVVFSDKFDRDRIYINGVEEKIEGRDVPEKALYTKKILDHMRKLAAVKKKVLIVSENNFPSSAGIASSASGAATLTFALTHALNLKLSHKEMSIIARQISGSACRSLFGGIVKWNKGVKNDGTDSYAEQIVGEKYWPELVNIIAIVDSSKKKVSTSAGHSDTVNTSPLYPSRLAFAEDGVRKVEKAIGDRDIDALSRLIMRDSNDMHATMLDTWPPIMYLNDSSKEIMYAVYELNQSQKSGKYIAGYTFDAGPNAHIITTESNKDAILKLLSGISGVKKIIISHAGKGPRLLKNDDLIDAKTLQPKIKSDGS